MQKLRKKNVNWKESKVGYVERIKGNNGKGEMIIIM